MKDPHDSIDQLSHADALSVLRTLADEDEQTARRITKIVRDRLSDVDREDVADSLYADLGALEVEEVWERAGRKRHGYVEPTEAAYQMVEEALEPRLDELRKYRKLGMSVEATRLCLGLLMGLYRFEHESTSEFKEWAPDVAIGCAAEVVEAWREGGSRAADAIALRAFVENELGGWGRGSLDG